MGGGSALRQLRPGAIVESAARVGRSRAEGGPRSDANAALPDARPVVQIIVTPGSGEGRARATARSLARALTGGGYGVHVSTFSDLKSLFRWTVTCDAVFSHLLCVGGDSTQSVAAGAALRLGVPLLPVPNGFGNMFARAFGHTDTPEAVLALLDHGEVRSIDLGRVGTDLFLSHKSYGPLQQIEDRVEGIREQLRSRALRRFAYYMVAARYLLESPLPAIRLDVDGERVADDAVMVTVANVEAYRGFLSLTPSALPVDGLFDVFVMPRRTKAGLWMALLKLWLGAPGCWDGITLCRGRRIRVAVDGAPHDEIRTLPGAIRVLVPPGSVERLVERSAAAPAPAPVAPRRLTGRLSRESDGRGRMPAGRARASRPAPRGRSRSRPAVGRDARD